MKSVGIKFHLTRESRGGGTEMKEPLEQTAKDSPLSKVTKKVTEVVTEVISDIKRTAPALEPAIDFSTRIASVVTAAVEEELRREVPEMLASSKKFNTVVTEVGRHIPEALIQQRRIATVIAGVGKHVPDRIVTSEEIEKKVGFEEKFNMPLGSIEKISGVRERRYVADNQASSDMAYEASKIALERAGVEPDELDIIIFASASHDIAEPATANILQDKLKATKAHVLDVKNACNSFLNGVDVMDSFMQTGRCRVGLVAAGEVLSKFVNFDIETIEELGVGFSAFTLGDGGGAIVFKAENEQGRGIRRTRFSSDGSAWELATIKGGGTLHPFDITQLYFISHSAGINKLALRHIPSVMLGMMRETGWRHEDVDRVVPHQVTRGITERIMRIVNLPPEKAMYTITKYGNTAAASIPIALTEAIEENLVHPNSRVMLVGGASGFSAGVMTVVL
jgi:3-oxoacyl-(acyl-carrier-protein) synthase III